MSIFEQTRSSAARSLPLSSAASRARRRTSRTEWGLVFAAGLAAGAGLYWFLHHGHAVFDVSAHSKTASSSELVPGTGAGRILYYRNPMGLPDVSPVPKKDSMGMDYIPVYAGEKDEDFLVKLTPGKLQRSGVRSEPVVRQAIIKPLRVPGTVQLDERRVAVVSTRTDAFIDHVENVTTGDRVRKGQILMHLYAPEIVAAGAQYISNIGFDGARRRLENLNVSPEVIAEMARTRKVPAAIAWTAPRDGIVLERRAVEGMKAGAGEALFRLADISRVWVLADVPEHDIGGVGPGASVTIRVRSLPGQIFKGRVERIYPRVMGSTRAIRVRVEIGNPDGLLLPDMYADVEIETGSPDPVLAVPDNAVIDTGLRQLVIIDRGEGRFEPREIKTGARGSGLVAIRQGLEGGENVVVAANFLIDAESNLKAALGSLAAGTMAQ